MKFNGGGAIVSYAVAAPDAGPFGFGGASLVGSGSSTGDAFSCGGGSSPRIDVPAGFDSNTPISGSIAKKIIRVRLSDSGDIDMAVFMNPLTDTFHIDAFLGRLHG